MRRIGIPVVLALAAVGMAGSSTPADARSPLTVEVDCAPFDLSFSCDAVVSGGATPYLYYYWTVTESQYGQPPYQYQVTTSSPTLASSCRADYHVDVSVMVLDHRGSTATGGSALGC